MINRTSRISLLVLTLALLSSVSFAQSEPCHEKLSKLNKAQSKQIYKELPNFDKVTDGLYRGGQPLAGGINKLAELGIKTIINLRGEDDDTRAEQKQAEAAGLRYFSVPLPGYTRPTNKQIARVMEIIDAPENGPVFVHCKRGSDRTGTVVAAYRISHKGWTAECARSEASRYGMYWAEFGMKDFISDYYAHHISGSEPQGIKGKMKRLPDLVVSFGYHGMRLVQSAGHAFNLLN